MDTSILIQNQLLATKFYVPVASGALISRSRLTTLLAKSLEYPLTLISAPAGFGKTTLLSAWKQLLPVSKPLVAWVSLDEEDNEPRQFWTYVLTALEMQHPERFVPLLKHLQSPQAPPLKYVLTALINLLVDSTEDFVLILDDYHVITEQEVHSTLGYLIEHLPSQLHIILATRTSPSLPLAQLRARKQVLEVGTDQLRCTAEETNTFFQEVIGIWLPDETIQQVATRTEGWLVGLHLLRLSLPDSADPLTLLQEVDGKQRYILDYLTEEVLRRQAPEVQSFLLSTCILERLSASLCDALVEQAGSQQLLRRLEEANLFVVSLDSKREWYRYHALFAEALRYRLEQMHPSLVVVLHHRASIWYAEHDQTTQAILHALHAKEWQWAADLIERKSLQLLSFTWGASKHEQVLLMQWLEQLPFEVMGSLPRLCLACAQLLWQVTPPIKLDAWLDTAQATLAASLTMLTHEDASRPILTPQVLHDRENQLGEVIASRAFFRSFQEGDVQAVLSLCQQALALLSAENGSVRALVARAQLRAYYASSVNDATAAIESGLQAVSLAQAAGQVVHAISLMGSTAMHIIGAGQLHKTLQMTQQAMQLGRQPGGPLLPEAGYVAASQAEILREWNKLDAALSLAEEAISLCQQTTSIGALVYLLWGYVVLMRVYLSLQDLDAASSTLEQIERIGRDMNQPIYIYQCSHYTAIDQIRLWLAHRDLDRAQHWAQALEIGGRYGMPFAHEREEMARVRVLLATNQPATALQRLEPVLQRATAGKRWGHVIEIRLLQALAYQMHQEEAQALEALSKAVRLAEPESYIRSFVEEGASMEALLYRLRKRHRKSGLTPYLNTLLAAFQQESKAHVSAEEPTKDYQLPEPLSQRELQVLQLLARGESNQEIGQELVIVVDTVKRHVSHIFSKLGVPNRVQAVRQARELGLLGEEY